MIRRLARDLHIPTKITGVATVREEDGLAMSSRNVRLTALDRAAAVCLSQALTAARSCTTIDAMQAAIRARIHAEPRARLRAIDIVEAATFAAATGPLTATVGIMISAEFGPPDNPVLLIDQTEVSP